MKTVQLQIEDTNFDAFLTVINNLKEGLIKNFKIQNTDNNIIETVSDEEQDYYEDLIINMSDDDKQISSKETFSI